MTGWFDTQKRTWGEWAVIRVLKVGPIPKHLAIVMDANGRDAEHYTESLETIPEYSLKIIQVLGWCLDLDISEITVYTFSIENFKIAKDEADILMNMAAEKFKMLLRKKDKLNEYGVCVKVQGKLELLPEEVRKLITDAVFATDGNTRCIFNVVVPYTSKEELIEAYANKAKGLKANRVDYSDMPERIFNKNVYRRNKQDPDLVIRTTGEVRLSDFLFWQSAFSCLYLTKILWQDFTIWNLFGAVFYYQRYLQRHHLMPSSHS